MTESFLGEAVMRWFKTTKAVGCSISLAVLLVIAAVSAAGADPGSGPGGGDIPSCDSDPSLTPTPTPDDFDPGAFSDPTTIDNQFLPSIPGTRFILDGFADRGNGILPHRVVLTVSDMTKVIDGVRTIVVWDQDINDGRLVEAELAFHAQDDADNIWNLGEYPEEFEDGTFVGAPSTWIAGIDGSEPGIGMLADPQVGTAGYLQGWAPSVEFADCAKVLETGTSACVTLACYQDVLTVDEWNLLEPSSGHQRKFYAPGVGNIQIGAVNDPEGEILELVDVVRLGLEEMAQVRDEVLELDRRGRDVNDVYRQTAPLDPPPGVSQDFHAFGKAHSNYGTTFPNHRKYTAVELDVTGGSGDATGFVAFKDRRTNPPGSPTRPFSCRPENALVTSAELVSPHSVRVEGGISCWGISSERSFVLEITDNGTNPPALDAYHMTLLNGGGRVLYDWSDLTTPRRGDLAVEPRSARGPR
jgi:hypothetical protein